MTALAAYLGALLLWFLGDLSGVSCSSDSGNTFLKFFFFCNYNSRHSCRTRFFFVKQMQFKPPKSFTILKSDLFWWRNRRWRNFVSKLQNLEAISYFFACNNQCLNARSNVSSTLPAYTFSFDEAKRKKSLTIARDCICITFWEANAIKSTLVQVNQKCR